MKRYICIFVFALIITSSFAQTQTGYVKTKGRMINGQLVPGQGLKGATVSIKGRTTILVSSDDGAFSFPVPEAQFRVDSVRKKEYQLVDLDACPRTYKVSGNPLYLVMETPEQQLQDKLNAERKIRRNLQKQLQENEDEIEALKEQHRISEEEYRQALQKLYADQECNEQLITDMAKRYSELDYDQLDEFYRQVSSYIENGELVRADSLLKTRGDITAQVGDILQRGHALQEEKEQLQKAEAVQQADIEEAARRCHSYYETFVAQHLNDTAAYYLELRASLDTTNVDWQLAIGIFHKTYIADYSKALSYYQLALRQAQNQHGNDHTIVAHCYNSIGVLYKELGEFNKALEFYEKAMIIWKAQGINRDIATCCLNIGNVYNQLNNDTTALHYFNLAAQNTDMESEEYAQILSSLGIFYDSHSDFERALEYHQKALLLFIFLFGENDPNVATCYSNLSTHYFYIGDYEKAIVYNEKALVIRELLFGRFHPDVADCYNNIAEVLCVQNHFDSAIDYMLKAIEIYQSAYGSNSVRIAFLYKGLGNFNIKKQDYETAQYYIEKALNLFSLFDTETKEIASCQNSLGLIQNKLKNYDAAMNYYFSALRIDSTLFGEYSLPTADIYNNLSGVFNDVGNHNKGLEYALKSLEIRKQLLGESHSDVARSYNNAGISYAYLKDYETASFFLSKAQDIWISLFGVNNLDVAIVSNNIAYVSLKLGHYEKAVENYWIAINTYTLLLGEKTFQIALFYRDLGNSYYALERFNEALYCYQKSIEIIKATKGEDDPKLAEIRAKVSEIQTKIQKQETE